ncbi:MAG: serine--tRNA ligase [Spirochaetota bacterium]|nr:serine--tRNA ligase [Spirochaetota bacterium]
MLDIEYITNNPKQVEACAKNKKFPVDISKLLELNEKRKELIQKADQLRAERNTVSKEIPKLQGDEKQAKIDRGKAIRQELSEIEPHLDEVKSEFDSLMIQVPNIHLDKVPLGKSDEDNVELRTWGSPREFDFKAKDHVELGEVLDIIDIPRGVKISGSKQYFLKNEGAMLEWAILHFSLNSLINKGFKPFIVPVMVRKEAMTGTGYFPGGEEQAYTMEKDELYLVGTSEVALASYHRDETLNETELPIKMAGLSNCFRREAGTYGKDTQGLYRIHQFQKVEQVVIGLNDPEESKKIHLELLSNAEQVLQALELPYRVVLVCTGDLGMGQVIKHDIECWMPSRSSYGETHSCSSLYDFQSRRLNIKYKDKSGKSHFAHTLNNTCIASPRILIPFLEHHQQADGSVKIPEALWTYMNGKKVIEP